MVLESIRREEEELDEEIESDPLGGLLQPDTLINDPPNCPTANDIHQMQQRVREIRQLIGWIDAERTRLAARSGMKPSKTQGKRIGNLRRRGGCLETAA